MPLPLSYPGLKCVLKNLETVKRAHIIGRSPCLQKIDKLIPRCFENLHIGKWKLVINKLWITCNEDEVRFKMNRKTFIRQRAESHEEKMKKLINFFTCGRSIIPVHRLCWCDSLFTDFLPIDQKFRVNSLYALFREEFETALSSIDSRSFPLKTLVTSPMPSTIDSHIAISAETIILFLAQTVVTLDNLKKIYNKKVVFQSLYPFRIEIVLLIKYQIESKKATGTTLVIAADDKGFIKKMLQKFKKAFGEYRSTLDGVNERFIPGLPKFSIPINNESRIQVYAIEDPEFFKEDFPYNLIVKSISEISRI
ncbi:hypothetical protein CRE_17387 [Caenorhabditis remanei]|uniref:DUF38 domain-containing protein n=1 Tax=Caenorhabditis remanei TaxID=31234 RepID=E3N234_CAERE|nr:hypothetical protein CRE_17387 [Caenorhabditis remanei]